MATSRPRKVPRKKRSDDYGQRYELATALYDGPLTAEELAEHLRSYLKLIGLFTVYARLQTQQPHEFLLESIYIALEEMIEEGWVVQSDNCYALTDSGREAAEKPMAEFRRMRSLLAKAVLPETVSKVSLIVHLVLAGIKLPMGIISGSVGLINDGVDTLLDGFSSLLVLAGIRSGKERLANVFLILLMLGTGGFAFYEAVQRYFSPVQPVVNWITYVAVVVSAILCGILWIYQRLIGLESGNMALITQSIDSRNHVIVAGSVSVGLIAAALQVPLLDTIVGTVVAGLILKSALDVALEVIRNWNEETFDLSSYKLGIMERYKSFRQNQFCEWILLMVHEGRVHTKTELERCAKDSLNFDHHRTLRELGVSERIHREEEAMRAVETAYAQEWLEGEDSIHLTDAGLAQLQTAMKGLWLKPVYPSRERMNADMAHYVGRVAHEGRGPQRRFRREKDPHSSVSGVVEEESQER